MSGNMTTSKEAWSWDRKAALLSLLIAVVACILGSVGTTAAVLVVPEFRQLVGLDPRPKSLLENVERLAPGVDISVYQDEFGKPAFINHFDTKKIKEYVFVNTDFYVDAVTDINDAVKYFAVTTRNASFHPVFQLPNQITLGVSKFSDIQYGPSYVVGCTYLKTFTYYETLNASGASNYQEYGFGVNPAGYISNVNTLWSYMDQHREFCPDTSGSVQTKPDLEVLKNIRSQTIINTYAVSAPDVIIKDNTSSIYLGVNSDQVSLLKSS